MGAIDQTKIKTEEKMSACCSKNYIVMYCGDYPASAKYLIEHRLEVCKAYFQIGMPPEQKEQLMEIFLRINEKIKEFLNL